MNINNQALEAATAEHSNRLHSGENVTAYVIQAYLDALPDKKGTAPSEYEPMAWRWYDPDDDLWIVYKDAKTAYTFCDVFKGVVEPIYAQSTVQTLIAERDEALAAETAREDAIENVKLINILREDEGSVVGIETGNAGFICLNLIVTCTGDWTGGIEKSFAGETLLEALKAATKALRALKGKP